MFQLQLFLRRVFKVNKKNILWQLMTMLILLWVGFMMVLYVTEGMDLLESCWQVWQAFSTVGYGTGPAETDLGKIATMLFSAFGIAAFGAILSSYIENKTIKKERIRLGMTKNRYKDGYIIFNYPGEYNFRLLISEALYENPNTKFCVVDNDIDSLPESISTLGDIHFIRGGETNRETYKMANILNNRVVMVFPANSTSEESDASTRTIVDLILQHIGDRNIKVMHFLVNPDNQWMFKNLKSIPIYQNLGILSAVQEAQDNGSAIISHEILHNSKGVNPQTFKPNKIVGMDWRDFVVKTMDAQDNENMYVNPFAIIKDGIVLSAPHPHETITHDSEIMILALPNFDWNKFEKEIL